MTTLPQTTPIVETLRGIRRDVQEVIATMHYERGQSVTALEGWQIDRCYDTLSHVSICLRQALVMAEALPEVLSTLQLALEALNEAPRFRIRGLDLDSYGIASRCTRVIAEAKGKPLPPLRDHS
jgi:hypothetical protein